MPKTIKTKTFKDKNLLGGKVSKQVSKARPSRLKEAPPGLVEFLDLINHAPRMDEVMRDFEADKGRLLTALNTPDDPFRHIHEKETSDEWIKRVEENDPRFIAVSEKYKQLVGLARYREFLLRLIKMVEEGTANYLKECKECGNIFFAGRKDRQGCSDTCTKRIHKRQWRKKYQQAESGYMK